VIPRPDEAPWPRVSVVTLTCGSLDVTTACLRSVAACEYPDMEIVVVSNGAGPAVESGLRAFAERMRACSVLVRVIGYATNLGACTARNLALGDVEGEFVAFIDNDILCNDGLWLRRAVAILRNDQNVGMVGPRIVAVARPAELECAGYAIHPRGKVFPLGQGESVADPRWRVVRPVQAVGNFVSRAKTLRSIGGFDTDFDPFGFENVECGCRFRAAGYSVICDGQSDLLHVGHVTTGSFGEKHRSILFSKSLLLRKRWGLLFSSDREFFARLIENEASADQMGASA